MSKLTALAVSIALLGGVWTYLALGPLAGLVLVWAGFIAWGAFFHNGGDNAALQKTIAGTIYGALIGWVGLLLIVNNPFALPAPLWPALVVAATVFFLVIVAGCNLLSSVPSHVYGYVAIVAYSLHQPTVDGVGPLASLTAASFANPLILVSFSLVLGAIFGLLSGKLSGVLSK
ncbi:MAG: DUF1097 domain-containing protein [Methylophilaceae bacterium]|nr:DUF1097 domain-containing protein [Methylophilaceae bacterium]